MAEIAIIIPVWHHPALVSEAIASVMAQQDAPEFHIIIVNDGCDMPETARALEGWRAKYPDKITVLTQQNRGLSAARNTGIEHALKNPTLRAVFFLDADNQLDPHALALFFRLLDEDTDAGWFYPQFDMFGMNANNSNGGAFSLSRLALTNICDAGSLVRKAVLDTGLRFDVAMRIGFEDWDFWLSAAQRGFVGVPIRQNCFRYRKRPDSMISAAMNSEEWLRAQLRSKHQWLFGTRKLKEVWSAEWPRFAMIGSNEIYSIGSDMENQHALSQQSLIQQIYAQQINPDESRFPQMLVFYHPDSLEDLFQSKLLDSCLYQLEGGLETSALVGLRIQKGDLSVQATPDAVNWTSEVLGECGFLAISVHHLDAALKQTSTDEIIDYLIDDIKIPLLEVKLPHVKKPRGISRKVIVDFIDGVVASPLSRVSTRQYKNWRVPAYKQLAAFDMAQINAGGRPALSPHANKPCVGFVVPIFHFGGVEKCVVALARELKAKGIECHLFIYGNDSTRATDWMFEPFEKIWMLTDPKLISWEGDKYLGTGTSLYPGHAVYGDAIGPLTSMDAVVNCGSVVLHRGLYGLRSMGIKTVTWNHLIEETFFGRSSGHPFLAVGYEAGYDLVLTCSNQLADQLAGHGVPRAKLLALPNGPGFPMDVCNAPKHRNGPLRVGFLGRFDKQKGLDRFVEIAGALRDRNFEFKICGAAVLETHDGLPEWLTARPPIFEIEELVDFYSGIDVLVLPSRSEGLPLTILEAQRAGIVCLCSNVGAVSEAVIHEKNGILLPADKVIESAIDWLKRLENDRATLLDIAQNAAGKPDNWAQNAQSFIKAVFE